MKFIKLGRIFNPRDFNLAEGCVEFSQSPQTLVFDDFIRIYFSSRSTDSTGKFLSHICFIDVTKDFKTILAVNEQQVLALGDLGAFDEHGIFPINIVRDGSRVLGYTTGWNRRVSVSVDTAIGIVESFDDGKTFSRLGSGPVLASSSNEACLVGDGFVKIIDDRYHMWYIFGKEWERFVDESPPDRVYKIAHASSDDGVIWEKDGGSQIIEDVLGSNECQALPTVVEVDGIFHMFFCYREAHDFRNSAGRGYRIGHAWSDDLVTWVRDDTNPQLSAGDKGDWDESMQCYPHVFECDSRVFLLYNGNQFGKFGFGVAELVDE